MIIQSSWTSQNLYISILLCKLNKVENIYKPMCSNQNHISPQMEQVESGHLNLELILPWSICIMALPHNIKLTIPGDNCKCWTLNGTSSPWNPCKSTKCGICTGLEVSNKKWRWLQNQPHKECKHQSYTPLL